MALEFPAIDPIAFTLGPFSVRWYALAYVAGFLLGWWYAVYLVKRGGATRPNKLDIDDYLPWAIAAVILGGRLGYVLFYQAPLYMDQPLEIFKIWHGGMSYHGGVIGVVISLIVYARLKKIPLLRLCDIAGCAAPIGIFFGRITNFINGELYGKVTDAPWGVIFPGGGEMPRHPSQIYEAVLEGLCLFLVLFALSRVEKIRERPGFLSGMYFFGYGVFRSIAEIFREPDFYLGAVLGPMSMGQVLSVPMMLAGIFLMVFAFRKQTV